MKIKKKRTHFRLTFGSITQHKEGQCEQVVKGLAVSFLLTKQQDHFTLQFLPHSSYSARK